MLQRLSPVQNEPGVVASSVYAQGKRIADVPIDETGAWAERAGHVVWIGLFEPSADLLHRVQTQLHLHPLAIEDAGKPHQQPKIEQYGEALFIVARTAQILEGRVAFGETHLFVGKGYVSRCAMARQRPTQQSASVANHARPSSLAARTTSSMQSSTSSSTTTRRCLRRSTKRWKRSKTAFSKKPPTRRR